MTVSATCYPLQVVLNVGLCIALFDITSLGDSYIFPGDGASHTRVTFRYVVFRPFLEEILEGVIKSANADGMQGKLQQSSSTGVLIYSWRCFIFF